jgi:hypothetical protein
VCGPRPYSGDLLIGGKAQLTGVRPFPPRLASLPSPPRARRLPDLVLGYGSLLDMGPVQLVRISLANVDPCPAPGGQSVSRLPGGTAEGIAGFTSAPLQQSWPGPSGWWHGPHASQTWPLTGTVPGVPAGVLGTFTAVRGLRGGWARPVVEYVKVAAVDVPVAWSIDSAVPAPSDPGMPIWSSLAPISPMARLTDSASVALLQQWLVIFAVRFGVGGSMLASLLCQWLRPQVHQSSAPGQRHREGPRSQDSVLPRPQSVSPAVPGIPGRWLAVVGAVIVIGFVRRRRVRQR